MLKNAEVQEEIERRPTKINCSNKACLTGISETAFIQLFNIVRERQNDTAALPEVAQKFNVRIFRMDKKGQGCPQNLLIFYPIYSPNFNFVAQGNRKILLRGLKR